MIYLKHEHSLRYTPRKETHWSPFHVTNFFPATPSGKYLLSLPQHLSQLEKMLWNELLASDRQTDITHWLLNVSKLASLCLSISLSELRWTVSVFFNLCENEIK